MKTGYSIRTWRMRLVCPEPIWLDRTEEYFQNVVEFYYHLLRQHEELWNSSLFDIQRSLELLSLAGRDGRQPTNPLPMGKVPVYLRRAAINKASATVKSTQELQSGFPEKLEAKVHELLEDSQIEDSRIAAEVVLFSDKICNDEETVRLHSHIQGMKKMLEEKEGIGRKLDFMAQEMNREANTILSKSNDLIVSNAAIDLKTEIEKIRERARATGDTGEDVLELLDMIERGFDDIEHRISNMDKEHSKYVRATVTRLNYLLSGESDTKGLVIQLLNRMSEDDYEEVIQKTGEKMNLSLVEILSEKSLYKRRKNRKDFVSQMAPEEEVDDLDREDVLRLNRIKRRFSKKQIEEFIEEHMEKDMLDTEKLSLTSEDDFEKLILAYDLSTRKNSKYKALEEDAETIEKNGYRYPALKFVRRHL